LVGTPRINQFLSVNNNIPIFDTTRRTTIFGKGTWKNEQKMDKFIKSGKSTSILKMVLAAFSGIGNSYNMGNRKGSAANPNGFHYIPCNANKLTF